MNHLMNFIGGFASIPELYLSQGRNYIIQKSGFETDRKNLVRDTANVGSDLKESLRAYGKQSRSSTGYQ